MEILVLRLDCKSWHFANLSDGRGRSFRSLGLLNSFLSLPLLSAAGPLFFSMSSNVEQAFPTGAERGHTHSDSLSTCTDLLGEARCIS